MNKIELTRTLLLVSSFNANKGKLCYRKAWLKKKSGCKTEKTALKALLEVKATSLRGETKHIENDILTENRAKKSGASS